MRPSKLCTMSCSPGRNIGPDIWRVVPASGRAEVAERSGDPVALHRSERDYRPGLPDTMIGMESSRDVEFVFEPQVEGGYHAYAPELPGLHTEGDSLEEATANAEGALALYVGGLREEGASLQTGIIRRKLPMPA